MKNLFYSLGLSALLVGYIILISFVLSNGESWFGQVSKFWGPVVILSLFVFSALVTSGLALGRPIWLYFEGKKRDAIISFFMVTGWLFVFLASFLLTISLIG